MINEKVDCDNQNVIEKTDPQPVTKVKDMEKVYMDELKFNSSCLIKHPKSYATWYHRRCIIRVMKNPPFKEEVQACDHFLELDERNCKLLILLIFYFLY